MNFFIYDPFMLMTKNFELTPRYLLEVDTIVDSIRMWFHALNLMTSMDTHPKEYVLSKLIGIIGCRLRFSLWMLLSFYLSKSLQNNIYNMLCIVSKYPTWIKHVIEPVIFDWSKLNKSLSKFFFLSFENWSNDNKIFEIYFFASI